MGFPLNNQGPASERGDGAVRVWLSQRQWMAILQDTERRGSNDDIRGSGVVSENQRESPRLPTLNDARCMLRLGDRTDDRGTYMVRLRDISSSGLGFYSVHAFSSKTRCTVAIQASEGRGLVCAGRVVWCRPEDDGLHNVGIQFDRPIDPSRFSTTGDGGDFLPDVPC